MALPANANWTRFRSDFDALLQAEGTPCEFRLKGGGSVFTLRARVRNQAEDELTAGMQQDFAYITVMANRWEAASPGRDPSKGDMVVVNGKRHMVQETKLRIAANLPITWTLQVKG